MHGRRLPLATDEKPSGKPDDKRRAPRLRLSKGTKAQIRSTVPVDLVDLSATGILMELPIPLRPGSTCDVSANLAGTAFTALVRITRCRAGGYGEDATGAKVLLYQAGGEFVGLSEHQLASLSQAISKIGGARLVSQSSAFLKSVKPG